MTDTTMSENAQEDADVNDTRQQFRDALLHARQTHVSVGEVEAAAAHFCQALRREGVPPERMLIEAKQVISDAIDGEEAGIAERAVRSCIQHYYRS
jgi:hypothetical protein